MQCKKCGETFNGMFCPKCGTKIDDEQVKTVNHKNSSIVVRIMILFTIICFAFPFFNVSCSAAEEVSVDYSGFQLVGIVKPDKENQEFNDETGNNKKPNAFIAVSLAALAAAFVITFIRSAKKYTFIMNLVSGVSLLLSKITFSSYYNFSDYEAEIIVKTKLGFYLALVMIIISALCAYIIYSSNYGSAESTANVPALSGPASTSTSQNDAAPLPVEQYQEKAEPSQSDNTVENNSEDNQTVPDASGSEPETDLQNTEQASQ